jgi:hypothetical protein
MVWKDKQAMVLLSAHAESIALSGPKLFVYRKIGAKKKIV